jgi:exonuclease SbcC
VRVEAEIEALAGALAAYGQETAAATTRHERAQALAVGAAPPDLAGLEAAVIIAAAACDEATEARARATAAVEGYRTAAAAHDAVMAETAALQRRFGLVGRLADVAGGDNPLKLSFQRYVLGRFLDEVLEHASFRLLHMSRGRFRLQRASGIVDGRRAGGLDLEVFDEQTATLRPVSTLSGGEGFLASLALSLSLADVVQAHAGGLRLETMFVDEGFGTLDPEALDAAIETLIQLAGAAGDGAAGRLVGVISHVPELRERIDARLEVIPGPRGSTARFVVA